MKIKLLPLCLACLLGGTLPLASQAASTNAVAESAAAAPTIASATLSALSWQPMQPGSKHKITLDGTSPRINEGEIQGAIAAIALPANNGSLEVTLSSLVKDGVVYAPNVLLFDQNMRPAAFFPSDYFGYERPGVMSSDRLEGTMKLTPALGQQQIYMLVYTTRADKLKSTKLIDPAKAYAEGVGNAVPNIPDPIARHSDGGLLELKVKSERNSGNITIGQVFSAPQPQEVVVGDTRVAAPAPAAPAAQSNKPPLGETEAYFNNAIRQAVEAGDVDKALNLLSEAERLGSTSARKTFISSIKGKG